MNRTKSLECPFTWGIDDLLISQYDEEKEFEVSVYAQPVITFTKSVITTYINIEQENDAEIESNLYKTDKIWNEVINTSELHNQIKNDKISLDVLLHIKDATKFCALEKIKNPEANQLFDKIINSTDFRSKFEIATIEGCKSIAWLTFHQHGYKKAMECAKLAFANSPDCSLWNFLLAKTLRLSRRSDHFSIEISAEEKNHFIRSYDLLPIPYYGIYVAEMYRDLGKFDKCNVLLETICNDHTSDVGILLRLTKCFISSKNFKHAKSCIDTLQNLIPNNSGFLHYQGLYFEKQEMYKEAIICFKAALIKDNKNYMAECSYIRCMIRTQKTKFKYLEYLKDMAVKYDGSTRQRILLDIALFYYFRGKNIKSAAHYFWQSIKINPEIKFYQNYYNYHTKEWINVFDFVQNELLQKFLVQLRYYEDHCIAKDLKNFCAPK